MQPASTANLQTALALATKELLCSRGPAGHWEGELSSSALATATAVTAFSLTARVRPDLSPQLQMRIQAGLQWLAQNVNNDGGWGDTTKSLSNISTTALAWAAFGAASADPQYPYIVDRAACWLKAASNQANAQPLCPNLLAQAIIARYGQDRTFSVPILTLCALAGRLGSGRQAWRKIIALPFELAVFPRSWFAALKMPVVSYALPALIAIGQARHVHAPSQNPLLRTLRSLARQPALKVLDAIQPSTGGFLEATPLTSFVVMSLVGSGLISHPVVDKGLHFLIASQRSDGSWPIDTNLATWLTTLSINALSANPALENIGPGGKLEDWLLHQQYQTIHPYTNAAPGGWAWTDLPGGVPDADDTAGALLALATLNQTKLSDRPSKAVRAGVAWLMNLQNRDGGIPTFCRGWGRLPFDRSSPDLTAHALRAWLAWREELPDLKTAIAAAIQNSLRFLLNSQRPNGSWIPLWFGNQLAPNEENPLYGTSRVLLALVKLASAELTPDCAQSIQRATAYLIGAQQNDGSWSAGLSAPASIEETAWVVEALADTAEYSRLSPDPQLKPALQRGATWLADKVRTGQWREPAPLGFYFAKLWYYERLYPQIFTVAALQKAIRASQTL